MKSADSLLFVLALGCSFIASPAWAAAPKEPAASAFRWQDLLPRGFQREPRINLNIITEMTAEGKKLTPPDSEHPAYYIGADGGMVVEGDPVAGERPPKFRVLAENLQKALRVNGYVAADHDHTPTIYIFYRWGSYNQLHDSLNPDGSLEALQYRNLIERIAIVGGTKFAVDAARAMHMGALDEFRHRSFQNEDLLAEAFEDIYFVIADAYEIQAAQSGQRKLLWRTKLSTSSQGLSMDETLPSMVQNAGQYFGREMTEAVQIHPHLNKGNVDIGTPTVKEYIDPSKPDSSK